MTSLSMGTEITLYLLCTVCGAQPPAESPRLDNNLNCVDLSDLNADLPLEVTRSIQILRQTEPWERSTWRSDTGTRIRRLSDNGPERPRPKSRRPLLPLLRPPRSQLRNRMRRRRLNRRPLRQACRERPEPKRQPCPRLPRQARTTLPSTTPAPCVVWNEDEQLWFMYFHFYENQWKTGGGHQRTALATCPDLATNNWTTWRDEDEKLVPVLPRDGRTLDEQPILLPRDSTPARRTLARLPPRHRRRVHARRQVDPGSVQTWVRHPPPTAGHWDYFKENPVIHLDDGGGGRKGVYRPHFVGYLGDGEYLLLLVRKLTLRRRPQGHLRPHQRLPKGHPRPPRIRQMAHGRRASSAHGAKATDSTSSPANTSTSSTCPSPTKQNPTNDAPRGIPGGTDSSSIVGPSGPGGSPRNRAGWHR